MADRGWRNGYYGAIMRRGFPAARGLFLDGEEESRAVRDRVELGGTIFITCFSPFDGSRERQRGEGGGGR